MAPIRPFDPAAFVNAVVPWIRAKTKNAGAERIILGLSGGIDSAVVAHLSVRAVGPKNVVGAWLGCDSTVEERDDAEAIANQLDIRIPHIELAKTFNELAEATRYSGLFDIRMSKLTRGNAKSRLRMVTLYAIANTMSGVVIGTGDKSEDDIGYFTKYGDGGVDFSPISDIYKSEVRELGRFLGVPQNIIDKPSSPGLWEGQTAEGELGIKYGDVELVLEGKEAPDGIASKVLELRINSAHKRAYPHVFPWSPTE